MIDKCCINYILNGSNITEVYNESIKGLTIDEIVQNFKSYIINRAVQEDTITIVDIQEYDDEIIIKYKYNNCPASIIHTNVYYNFIAEAINIA